MNNYLKSNFHLLLIIVFAFLCYHFLWLNPYSMKWDMAEQYLPWRHFLGKSLQNGEIPFWNPYQLGGYPTFADPQSATWYYPAWIIGGIFGYSMQVIELEIVLLITLAGSGFYFLLKKLGVNNLSACIFSICYMCSGFIVGNAQHLTWIAAAAWMPWLFYHYLFLRKETYNYHLAWFLIVLYFFISSSYPAFVIVSAYALTIDQFVIFLKSKQKLNFILHKFIFCICCLLILAPIIYSVYTSRDFFSRGDSLTLIKTLQHPFSWQSLLSLISPFASFKNAELFKTDISMSNGYIGLLPIITILMSILNGSIRKNYLWLLLSILFLLIGFGEQTPIREILYNYVPGFNLFRFPSLFRLFFIISILIYSALQFEHIQFHSKKIKGVLLLSILFFITYIFIHLNSWHPFNLLSLNTLSKQIENTTFVQHIIFQFALNSILLLMLFLLSLKKIPIKYLLIICCFDLFINVHLNSMATMVLDTKTKNVDDLISNAPDKFTTPKLNPLYKNIDQQYEYRWPLNWNMNCYFGEIGVDGYNPFVLNTFNALSESNLKDSIWENSWYYFPSLIIYSDTPKTINSSIAWVNIGNTNKSLDTTYLNSKINVNSIQFTPKQFYLKYYSESNSALVFAQNPYDGWKASIDDIETNITTVNYSQQMIMIPKGSHQIKWFFKDPILTFITYIHLALFGLLLLFATFKNIRNLQI